MRTSKYLFYTTKEDPINTKLISHKLMIKSGMIRKLSSGIYFWLPIGLKVLKNIKKIIRKEINKIKLFEINIPIIQSANLWKKSKRFKKYGLELIKFYNRKKKLFILSPTNEEIINKVIINEINSYKQLPIMFYQIKTKFRDEIRPNLGIIKTIEFIMKDAYSFHNSIKCLKNTYNVIYKTYIKIFKKLNIFFYTIKAKSDSIGGNISHEFYSLFKNYKNKNFFLNNFNNINNIKVIKLIVINNKYYIEKPRILNFLNFNKITKKKKIFNIKIIKIIFIKSINNKLIALLFHEKCKLNIFKIYKLKNICKPLKYVFIKKINNLFKINFNSIKSFFSNINIIVDYNIIKIKHFVIKFIKNIFFIINLNWNKILLLLYIADLNNFKKKIINFNNKKYLFIKQNIEIGHIFQIGNKYSKINNKCNFKKNINMGCYGIGITRLIAAIIEQNYDKKGIIWPINIAPFKISIIPINFHNFKIVKNISNYIYNNLFKKKIDVLLDDRREQIGVIFNDNEIIGIPHLIIINKKNCKNGFIEYKDRNSILKKIIKIKYINNFLLNIINFKKINY
ncbi:MAG: proline--tRNA ligase [Enterobacteriaceae bacterium PSpicST1]|nr:MAG: proline--tRNA ligase [Enterobacteriaceae bacterium PSpicST1]